ncbi:MAG: HAMP domain-containing histidine kinase [Actinobacteria bacterium]|nr:HAMP domain-containing histidine kinase [Actinomycetota bacterium]
MLTFALIGLLAVTAMSVATYGLASGYLLSQRQASAVRQAQANARLVRNLLRTPNPEIPHLLGSLGTPSGGRAMVRVDSAWFAASAGLGPEILPPELRSLVVEERRPGRQRYRANGDSVVAVGIPLDEEDSYFEVFPLAELSRTLSTLRYSLLAAAAFAFVGSLSLGYWASRRVLRPVLDIGRAAASIAAGRLDARLDAAGDEELFALAKGFNSMVDSLQDRIERDARFASDVSHELRSPLTTLRSAVEIMQGRRAEMPPRSVRALDLLSEEVDRFEGLVTDLLEISRYDAGVASLELERVDLAALVARVLRDEGAAGVSVEVDAPSEDAKVVLVDRRRVEHSISNLVRNAVAHAGGAVAAGVVVAADSVSLYVEDRGPGVPPADREAVFQRFFRGSTSGRRSSSDGVGLGLALVHEQARLHGGQVWVEEVRPTGARFVIQLPRRSA